MVVHTPTGTEGERPVTQVAVFVVLMVMSTLLFILFARWLVKQMTR